MKREAFRHPKTFDLAARLGIPNAYAFSHVAHLLNATCDIAPQGDIGKWANGVIARGGEWNGDHDHFVASMIAAGWLDEVEDPSVRLLIHDWPDHAERFVRAKLAREKKWFHAIYYMDGSRKWDAPENMTFVPWAYVSQTIVDTAVVSVVPSPPCDPTQPNPTQPNPTFGGDAAKGLFPPDDSDARDRIQPESVPLPSEIDTPDVRAAIAGWFKQRRARRLSLRPEFITRQYERLLPLGPADAAACLRFTVDRDYQALCVEKFANGKRQNTNGPAQKYDANYKHPGTL